MDETSNGTTTTTATNGATPVVAEAKGETPLTRAEFDAWASKFTDKIGGEMASLRKKTSAAVRAEPSEKKEHDAAPPAPLTHADIRTIRELSRLEAKLGDEELALLGEEYEALPPAQQLLVLRVAARRKGETPKVETTEQQAAPESDQNKSSGDDAGKPGRDAQTKPSNPRGEAPRTRDSSPRPRSQLEWHALKKTNPGAHHALMMDPNFDPLRLPYKI